MNSVSSEIALSWVRPIAADMWKHTTEERQKPVPSTTASDQV